MENINLIHGDCIEEMKKLEAGSVDLILTDPPYGNMNGAELDGWEGNKTNWDNAIDPKEIFKECNRLLRVNGKLILFSQEPYTSKLITESISNLPFCYRMIWEKDHFANALISKKAPVSYFEDILVFSKSNPLEEKEFIHPLRSYFKGVLEFIKLNKKQIVEIVGECADHVFRFSSTQFSLCTEKTYNKLIDKFEINKMGGFKLFEELKNIDKIAKEINAPVFNLPKGESKKSNILSFKKDYGGLHPTQKPVALLKDLIKTYSNEEDIVLDFTAGSFSTLVACQETNRNGIGIELEDKYVEIGRKRLAQTSLNITITNLSHSYKSIAI